MADEDRIALLLELVKDKSDDEIYAAMDAQRTGDANEEENFVMEIVKGMVEAFDADKAAGQSATIQYDITHPKKSFSFQLRVKDGKCDGTEDTSETARVTLSLSFTDFLRLITGNLNGQQAFFSGKLKLAGDMMFAQTMESWFKKAG